MKLVNSAESSGNRSSLDLGTALGLITGRLDYAEPAPGGGLLRGFALFE